MAEFKLQHGQAPEEDARVYTLEPIDHYTPTADEVKYLRRLHGMQEQLVELSKSNEGLKNDENWVESRREFVERLRLTAESFIRDLILAEDAYLMTYVHQGYFEAMVANAAMTGGGRARPATQPGQRPTSCNHPQCPRRLLPASSGA
jgi:hypothetical protein